MKLTKRRLEVHNLDISVDDNSSEGDAMLFEEAARWCRSHPNTTVICVAMKTEEFDCLSFRTHLHITWEKD